MPRKERESRKLPSTPYTVALAGFSRPRVAAGLVKVEQKLSQEQNGTAPEPTEQTQFEFHFTLMKRNRWTKQKQKQSSRMVGRAETQGGWGVGGSGRAGCLACFTVYGAHTQNRRLKRNDVMAFLESTLPFSL